MRRTAYFYRLVRILFCLPIGYVAASSDDAKLPALPDPLTLEYVLSLADEGHPDLWLKNAELLKSKANKELIETETNLNVKLDTGLYVTDRDIPQRPQRQDHIRAGVIISGTLYDFGYTDQRVNAAGQEVNAQQWQYHEVRGQRRIDIMQAYLNVLLADLQFSQYNEGMSVGYVNFDKAKDLRDLGKQTDLEVLEKHSEYQRLRVLRYQSENLQRSTRATLAEILNRPDQLPANLAIPKLAMLNRKLASIEILQQQAIKNNFRIKSLQHNLQAAKANLAAARNSDNPVVNALLQAHQYESNSGSSDEVRAEFYLSYDLYKPDKDALVAERLANLYAARANLSKAESALRQSVLQTWHEIEELSVKRESLGILLELRELKLDESRALYEMEVKADLGFSMVDLTEAQYNYAQNDYRLALTWYKLDLLTANLKLTDLTPQPNVVVSEPE